jgi:hypothetical protein
MSKFYRWHTVHISIRLKASFSSNSFFSLANNNSSRVVGWRPVGGGGRERSRTHAAEEGSFL